jgi:hypothetical protein
MDFRTRSQGEWIMDKLKELLDLVYNIEGELDDAYYSIPEYDCNSDARSSVDGARCTLYELKSQMETMKRDVEEVTLEEVMNTPVVNPL